MRKILQVLLTLLLLFGSLGVYAQISEGGSPPSFASDIVAYQKKPFSVPITFDVARLKAENKQRDADNLPSRVAEIIPVNLSLKNSGEWTTLSNGQLIWRLTIKAPNAIATMLYYDEFYIPEGGKLFIYNLSRSHVLGAYTNNTNPKGAKFATEFVAGDVLTLEYVPPLSASKNVVRSKSEEARIQISSVGYGYNYLSVQDMESDDELKAGNIGRSGTCQVNINCSEGDNWQDHKKGIARTITRIGSSGFLCSGSMVNNTVQDLTPFFLTASHCFYDKDIETTAYDQILYYFHLEDSDCARGPAGVLPATSKTMVGATKLVDLPIGGGEGSDGGLLRLSSSIPLEWNVYFNGWDRSAAAATSGVSIHHPAGDVKKISTFLASATSATWNTNVGAPDAHWDIFFNATTNGHSVTEGGSSGSPMFNQDGRVVGTLTGGNSSCTNVNGRNLYGKLWYHWDQSPDATNKHMKLYLDPINTGELVLDGTYVQNNTPAANFSMSSETIYALESVKYVNYSSKALTNEWTFEGGVPSSSTEINPPAITYNAPGVFEAKLVINKGTEDEMIRVATINVTEKGDNPIVPVANFALFKNFILKEGFDVDDPTDFLPTGWAIENKGASSNTWKATNPVSINFNTIDPSSKYSAMVAYDANRVVDAWLKTTNYTIHANTEMEFYAGYSGSYLSGGSITFYISTDNGETWVAEWTTGSVNDPSLAWAWRKQSIDLSAYAEKTVQFAWQYYGRDGDLVGIDGILISGGGDPDQALSINVGDYVSPVDLSTGPPVLWEWDFPGGTPETSTDPAPKVQYMLAGTHDISLTVKSFKGEDTRTFKEAVKVVDLLPEVNFNVSEGYTRQSNYGLFIPANTTVHYTDKSSNYPTTWNWIFDGGTPASSSEQNPQVTYNTQGEYDLSLEIENTAGENVFKATDFVKVGNTTDKIWNMQYAELGQTVFTSENNFLTGSNSSYIDVFAERFDKPLAKGAITSVDILFHVVSATSGSLKVSILTDNQGFPGQEIQSVELLVKDINPTGYTTVKFPIPVAIDKGEAFYVSIKDFTTSRSAYNIAIASSDNRLKGGKNTAYLNNWLYGIFYGQSWFAFNAYYANTALSLNIVPEFTYTEFELIGEKKHTRKNIDKTVGELSVRANMPWKVLSDASWINITTDMQNNMLSFTVKDNNGYPRTGLIIVSTIDNGHSDFILVEQAAAGPSNLTATILDEKTGEIMLSWDAPLVKKPYSPGDAIFDGAEEHPNFKINSPGEFGWSYIDGDGAPTFLIQNVPFPNEGMPMAFNVFNPSAIGNGDNPTFATHTGQKYFTSFGAEEVKSNDWMISPKLVFEEEFTFSFWAKSYTLQYGAERLRVAYSTGDKLESNFTNMLSAGSYVSLPDVWTKYEFTVPAEARYVAINSVSHDAFFMMVDDFFIGTGEVPESRSEESIDRWKSLESVAFTKKSKKLNSKTSQSESMSQAELKIAFDNLVLQNKLAISVTDARTGNKVEGIQHITPTTDDIKPHGKRLESIPMQLAAKQMKTTPESGDVTLESQATSTLRWDDGEPARILGLHDGGKLEAAIRFTPIDVMAHNNSIIKAVDLFVATMPAGGITLKVYQGKKVVHSQKVASVKPSVFTRISLTKEIFVDASQDLYVGYEFVQAAGQDNFVLVTDNRPAVSGKGNLISIEGEDFENASNYNWSMAVIVEDNRGENYQLGYQVYRDDHVIAKTKELSQVDIISVTEACYHITALYNNQLESTSSNYACVTLEETPSPFELDMEITINGVSHNIDEVFNMECSDLTRLNVVVITNEDSKLEFVVEVDRPIVNKEFTVSSKDGSVSKQYILKITKYLKFEEVIVIRWNNTLAVVNNPVNNYAYTFVKYQWYKNNVAITGATGQYYSAGPNSTDKLNASDSYYVDMITSDGQKIRTCAKQPTLRSSIEVKVYPNPVSIGEVIYIDADIDIELLKGATVDIYNILGMRISRTNLTGRSTSINLPSASGLYILNLKGKDGLEETFKIIVR